MLDKLKRLLFGEISHIEMKKYMLLSITFFFTIGVYWLLRPLKDGIFFTIVGQDWQPRAKQLSLVVVLLLVFAYGKLVDMFKKHHLFYFLGTFYGVLFLFIAYFVNHPTIGVANIVDVGSHRWIGWLSYFAIESFGSLMVALFWSFVASVVDTSSAKRGFPIIIAGGQIGGLFGPYLAMNAKVIGVPVLFFIAALYPFLMVAMIKVFMTVIPVSEQAGTKQDIIADKKPKTGFLEGLKLLLTRSYLFSIFVIVSLYEVIGTIIDYQMKVQAKALPEYSTPAALTQFLGFFGLCTNGIALVMALLGSSYLMRRFGLTFCLLAFPISITVVMSGLYYQSSIPGLSPYTLMWTTFFVMIVAKGLSYALNNPAKDMMYIPTSKDAKFKTKSWIDAFGSRFAKAGGSSITDNVLLPTLRSSGMASFVGLGTLLSFGMIGVWLGAALFVGRKFVVLTKEGKIIE